MQRHILSAWNFLSVSSLVVPVIAVSNAGCNSQAVTPLEASIEVPARDAPVADVSIQDDSPPAPASANKVAAPVPAFFLPPQTGQLIEAIDRSLAETPAIPVEVEDLQQLEHGLDAAEDLILRNSDPVTVEAAWRSKLTLLYRGARKGQSDYSERLAAAARS
ncbi:MAG: hypothetical protein VB858_18155, partial [Planctomycetaceae bacterium]